MCTHGQKTLRSHWYQVRSKLWSLNVGGGRDIGLVGRVDNLAVGNRREITARAKPSPPPPPPPDLASGLLIRNSYALRAIFASKTPHTMLAHKSAALRWSKARLSCTRPFAASAACRPDGVGRSQKRPKLCTLSARTISTTPSLHNSNAELSKERELGAKEETNDVTAMDRLLKESRMYGYWVPFAVPLMS